MPSSRARSPTSNTVPCADVLLDRRPRSGRQRCSTPPCAPHERARDQAQPLRRHHPVPREPRVLPALARNSLAGIGSQMTVVAVGLHIYDITGSTGAVALVGVSASCR